MVVSRDVLFFSGQGSNAHFSDKAKTDEWLERLTDDAKQVWLQFLSQCQLAFNDLYSSLPEAELSILPKNTLVSFSSPSAFLYPPPEFQSHAVFQTTTLFVRQVLELMLYESEHGQCAVVVETTGVCTGVLPAILASAFTSYLSDGFCAAAVNTFRLSFWIGLRASLKCRSVVGQEWNTNASVLTVFKHTPETVEDLLASYNATLPPSETPLRLSAVFDNDSVSVTGPGPSLDVFQSTLRAGSCRWAHVHGSYHGGSGMKEVSELILADIQKDGIEFPTWDTVLTPVRSAATARVLTPDSSETSLIQLALENILVDTVDWKTTWDVITSTYHQKASQSTGSSFRVIGFGPSAKGLLNNSRSDAHDSRLRIIGQVSESMGPREEDDIAIVGISANFPGGKGVEQFWDTINETRSCAKEIPASRFDFTNYYLPGSQRSDAQRKMASKHGNFLDEPFNFDPGYFNISPREAKSMDPQQRLLLHAAVEALDDAGYSPNSTSSFQQDSVGVYVGVATGDYVDNLRSDIDVYYSPGTLRAFLSGRISYAFGFKGPSMVIDTACSSSMVSIYHACKALKSGDCTAALAGGVNVISSPDMYLGLSRAHFLSPTGQCKPFDAGADGYCRAEGCGLVVLKKLSQARKEGDHIYGVIRGIGVNQCGTAKSITHPDHQTQAALFAQTLQSARISPKTIDVVEAHGTGTQAGDFAEVSSLSSVFGGRQDQKPLYLCSVKGNIGHAEAASGVAGLIKLLLMLKNETIPQQASFRTLNPRLASNFSEYNLAVAESPQKWPVSQGRPRRALLNNFGAAGSNAALILEEAPRDRTMLPKTRTQRSRHLLTISARTAESLEQLKAGYVSSLRKSSCRLEDVCYTASVRRRHYKDFRWTAAASDVEDLVTQLQRPEPTPQRVPFMPSNTVFVFSGQGGANEGMGAELMRTSPVFRSAVDECDGLLKRHGFPIVQTYLDPTESPTSSSQITERESILIVQCACFVLQYGLVQLMKSLGLTPDIVLGHSIGEYAALVVSGVLRLEDALLFVARRADLMYNACKSGDSGMLACRLSPSDAEELLREHQSNGPALLSVACHNSPEDSVIAGPTSQLVEIADSFRSKGIRHKLLNVSYGFHSSAMDAILPQLANVASTMEISAPKNSIRVGSSVLGQLLDGDKTLQPDYFVKQTRQPVLFMELLNDIRAKRPEVHLHVVEIGPSTSASSMFKSAFSQGSYSYSPSLKPSEPSWTTLAATLSGLYRSGRDFDWASLYEGGRQQFLKQLPFFELGGQSYCVPYHEPKNIETATQPKVADQAEAPFEFLSSAVRSPKEDGSSVFRVDVEQFCHLIKAHAVGGVPLCPASVYLELALEVFSTTRTMSPDQQWFTVDGISFHHPLVYSSGAPTDFVEIQTSPTAQVGSSEPSEFSVASKDRGHLYCSGSIAPTINKSVDEILMLKTAYVTRQRSLSFQSTASRHLEVFTSRTIYDMIFPRVVSYQEPFRTLKRLTISALGLEGYGTFCLPDGETPNYVCSPVFVDTMLHAAGFIANARADLETACICTSLGRMVLPGGSKFPESPEMDIYCSLLDVGDSVLADAFVLDEDERVISFAEGMRFKKIRLSSFRAVLSQAAGTPVSEKSGSLRNQFHRRPDKLKQATTAALRVEGLPTPPSSTKEVIRDTIQSVCGVAWNPSSNSTLAELGVDSLLIIELTHGITSQFPNLEVSRDEIEHCQTVDELVRLVDKAHERLGVVPNGPTSPVSAPSISHRTTSSPPEHMEHDVSAEIREMFDAICGTELTPDKRDASLASLGVDSLLSIELVHEIQQRFGMVLDTLELNIAEMSIGDIEALCAGTTTSSSTNIETPGSMHDSAFERSEQSPNPTRRIRSPDARESVMAEIFSRLIPSTFPHELQAGLPGSETSSPSPVYIFHDGSGLSSMYARLHALGRPMKGVFSLDIPAIDTSIQSLEAQATLYIDRAKLMSENSPILCGWSFGGVLAFEVSRQLRQRGRSPKGIVLIDSPCPTGHEPLPAEIIASIVKNPDSNVSGAVAEARSCIEAQFRRHAMLLQRYEPLQQQGDVKCVFIHCKKTMDTEALSGVSYPWLAEKDFREESLRGWEQLLGQHVTVLEIDCNHFEVFEPLNVEDVSAKLKTACELLD